MVISAVASVFMGIGFSLIIMLSTKDSGKVEPEPEAQLESRPVVASYVVYWNFATWMILLGIFLILAPTYFFGPSWSYFPELPHNGFWMGVTCLDLGILQMLVIWKGNSKYRLLGYLIFLGGFVYWTSGLTIIAEGLAGRMGLMEGPFMMYAGSHMFFHSATLLAHARKIRLLKKIVEELNDYD